MKRDTLCTVTITKEGTITPGIQLQRGENGRDFFVQMHTDSRTEGARIYTKNNSMPDRNRYDLIEKASFIKHSDEISLLGNSEKHNENFLLVLLKQKRFDVIQGKINDVYSRKTISYCMLIAERGSEIRIPIITNDNLEWKKIIIDIPQKNLRK